MKMSLCIRPALICPICGNERPGNEEKVEMALFGTKWPCPVCHKPLPTDNHLKLLADMAARENDGKCSVVIRVWSDGTCDIEQFCNTGELDGYGTKRQRIRATTRSVDVDRLIDGIKDLATQEWRCLRVQAPQDARRRIADLENVTQGLMEQVARFLLDVPGLAELRRGLVRAHDEAASVLRQYEGNNEKDDQAGRGGH